MNQEKRRIGKGMMALTLGFFYLPIVFMILFSFNSSKSLTHFTGFSLRWYESMLKNHGMMESLYITVLVAVLATLISTVVGTITAIGLSQSTKKVRRFISQVDDFPLMNPDIVTAIGLMLLFITFRVYKGFMTMLLAHIAFCIPYVILSVMPKVRSLDPNLADAAMDLGATPFQAIRKVIVPEIMPGIISGALIAFTMSFDDFIISYFVTGHGIKNLSIMVYTMSKRVNPSVNAISTLVVVLITLVLITRNVLPLLHKEEERIVSRTPRQKRIRLALAGAVCVAMIVGLFGLSRAGNAPYAGQELHVYMPGEYLDEELVNAFESETGARVIIDNFDSNEQMYIKVANGENYDILIPSDYMIQRLIREDHLQPLDQKELKSTFKKVDPVILDLEYDPGNVYSLPYFWGSVGITYDKRKVSLEDLEREGYGIFLDEKYKGDIYLYDSERDSFMMALKNLGYSMNTDDSAQLQQGYDWLVQCVQTMEPEIVTDEIIDNMAQARKALGLMYSGDATYVMAENEDIGFYMPKEGTNIWTDAMVIPKKADNPKLAYEFMRYLTQDQQATANSTYVGYTSPNKKVAETLATTEFEGINAYVPRSGYDKDEVFGYNEKARKEIANLWSGVKV
ncbi:MAG: extracellular solute-binding protein, partial [Erysipelotrichaceae bacterium]|nr:extracellular solute-binding protein [Erysipelotrichaceae bacterium]